MITDGIITLLKNDATLSALTTQIMPTGAVKLPQPPYIVYHIGTTLDTNTVQGATGYRLARFQFDCYSNLYTEAKKIIKAVRGVLQNFKNTTLSDTDATFVQACLIDFESDMPMVQQGTAGVFFRVMVQVSVWYKES
jgi:hypothetical protein